MVAASLGHGSFEMTARHYAQPEAIQGARTARMVELLDLAQPSLAQTSAEQLVAELPPATLAKLLELANQRPAPPAPPPAADIAPPALRTPANPATSQEKN